ncbi:DUF2225 domain-containing protein [Clostridium sp. MB40-C1]|uniref:DUF2225 domain-containing protein n=1 Tax=Clostridium sp. MB40-C1 TaxID=3070996 RepID=UPI0027E0F32C|nr:DUF2225 domain-containing protein [Clostridium sp. MB40-C1]WMJ80590.1 DUF2225 domain-containing protein [Clostridium sp. MB40-C1]
MNKDIFSGLEKLGFNDINNIDLYKTNDDSINDESSKNNPKIDQKDCLYDKKLTCPVCGAEFTTKAIKTSSYRMKSKDTDFFIRYDIINPYFYDVWLCNTCGYAAMKSDFNRIRNYQIDLVKENVSHKWRGREYKVPYDINIAIERYKLSLLNYYYIESKPSKKAMNCLKLAWMCRLKEDSISEINYLTQAVKGFDDAYLNEDFPLYGMDRYATMYLIGELNRRIGNENEALIWFSKVVTTPGIHKRLKDLARDQKDLIKETQKNNNSELNNPEDTSEKKKGFFSSLLGK